MLKLLNTLASPVVHPEAQVRQTNSGASTQPRKGISVISHCRRTHPASSSITSAGSPPHTSRVQPAQVAPSIHWTCAFSMQRTLNIVTNGSTNGWPLYWEMEKLQRDRWMQLTGARRCLAASASSSFDGALWNKARSVFLLPAADAADPTPPPPDAARLFLPAAWWLLLLISSWSLRMGHFVSMSYGKIGCSITEPYERLRTEYSTGSSSDSRTLSASVSRMVSFPGAYTTRMVFSKNFCSA